MTVKLLDLPAELIIQILSALSFTDLLFSAQLTNHYLHDLVQNSSLLQYLIAAGFAGVNDNPSSKLVPAERLEALRRYERAWGDLAIGKRTKVTVQHRTSGLYDVSLA